MRVSLLLLFAFVTLIGCKKSEPSDPFCISHSNLSFSINDSLRISSCDTTSLNIDIWPEFTSLGATIIDTTLNPYDTLYLNFSKVGDYTLHYGVEVSPGGISMVLKKNIRVN